MCCRSNTNEYEEVINSNSISLPFNASCIENVILSISDEFNFRLVMNDSRVKTAALVTTGLSIAGGLIGRHYGGKVGAVVGGAIGGACGVGLVIVSMRSVWQDIKDKLSEVLDMVYDYLAGLHITDYQKAAGFLTSNGNIVDLALLIMETTSRVLGQKILSSLTPNLGPA